MSSVDCTNNPELCHPDANVVSALYGKLEAEGGTSAGTTVLVSIISVLSVTLIVGLVLAGFMYRRNAKARMKPRPMDRGLRRQMLQKRVAPPLMKSVPKRSQITVQRDFDSTAGDICRPPAPTILAVSSGQQRQQGPAMTKEAAREEAVQRMLQKKKEESMTFQNVQDKYEGDYRGRRGGRGSATTVKQLTELDQELDRRMKKGGGGISLKYKDLGGFSDKGNVHPKHDFKFDESNQSLWDIVMVRLSLINDDFVHKSRYISGQHFGFKHDILIVDVKEDEWEKEEVDSYESGRGAREGNMF